VAGSVDAVAVVRRLETDKSDLMEKILAAELLARVDGPLRDLLFRGLVFELPVPRAAMVAIAADAAAAGLIDRAVALGLLEVSPDGGVRVPRVLPLDLLEDEGLAAVAARVLYRLWWEEAEHSTEAHLSEIHRLAIPGRQEEIAIAVTLILSKQMSDHGLYRDSYSVCNKTIEYWRNCAILNFLAVAESHLGYTKDAIQHYSEALDIAVEAKNIESTLSILNNIFLLEIKQDKSANAFKKNRKSI
jgi:hypothetical protein